MTKKCVDCNGWGGYNDVILRKGPNKKYPLANASVVSVQYNVKCKTCGGTGIKPKSKSEVRKREE